VLFIITVAVIIALTATAFRFTDLMEKNFLIHAARSLWGKLTVTVLLSLIALWAVSTVVSMIAVFFNHPGGAIGAGLGLGMLLVVLGVFPSTRPFLLTTCIAQPVEQMAAMSKGIPLPLTWGTLIWRTAACSTAWIIAAFCIGAWWIRKKEITF
jgi:hypothetical protein